MSQNGCHLLTSPSNFFNSNFGSLTCGLGTPTASSGEAESTLGISTIVDWVCGDCKYAEKLYKAASTRPMASWITSLKRSASSISSSISSSLTRSRISSSRSRSVFIFSLRASLCCVSFTTCNEVRLVGSALSRVSSAPEIPRLATDLCPPRTFLSSRDLQSCLSDHTHATQSFSHKAQLFPLRHDRNPIRNIRLEGPCTIFVYSSLVVLASQRNGSTPRFVIVQLLLILSTRQLHKSIP